MKIIEKEFIYLIKIIAKYSIAFLRKYLYNISRFKIYIQVQIKILSKLPSGLDRCRSIFLYPNSKFFSPNFNLRFERYVNFEFYKTVARLDKPTSWFERYVNFEFYKTYSQEWYICKWFERYVNFEFYKTLSYNIKPKLLFERYVNFEFYKTELTTKFCVFKFERYVNFEFYKT